MRRSSDLDWSKAVGLFCIGLWLMLLYGVANGAEPPHCWPDIRIPAKVHVEPLPKGFREQKVAMWTCATSHGYTNVTFAYKDADLTEWLPYILSNKVDKAKADAACRTKCDVLFEDNLVAAMRRIALPYQARAAVTSNGDYTTRPVYPVNADGSRGTTAMPNARIAVGAKCFINARDRQTSFYRIDGADNALTPDPNDKIGSAFAQCSISLPLGSNGSAAQ